MGFKIYRGVEQDMEFKGFKAQFLVWMGLVLLGSIILFSILYAMGLPLIPDLALCVGLVMGLGSRIVRMGKTLGKHGLMKIQAHRRLPLALKIRDRGFVRQLGQRSRQSG